LLIGPIDTYPFKRKAREGQDRRRSYREKHRGWAKKTGEGEKEGHRG